MYDPKSLKAEEFIDHGEVLETLRYAEENCGNREVLDSILAKARLHKGLTHREASVLLACEDKEIVAQVEALAREIKQAKITNAISSLGVE